MERYINFAILTTITATLVFAAAALALTVQPAKAQTMAESGASSLALGTNQKYPGEAKISASLVIPGQLALKAGIIGPNAGIKK